MSVQASEIVSGMVITLHCWGGSVWRGTVWAAPRSDQGSLAAPLQKQQNTCDPAKAYSAGADHIYAHYLTAWTHKTNSRRSQFLTSYETQGWIHWIKNKYMFEMKSRLLTNTPFISLKTTPLNTRRLEGSVGVSCSSLQPSCLKKETHKSLKSK